MVIDRVKAYSGRRRIVFYAPGIKTPEQISAVCKAVAPKPVNHLIGASGLSVAQAADLGVRRNQRRRLAGAHRLGGFMRAAREIAAGTFAELGNGYPAAN